MQRGLAQHSFHFSEKCKKKFLKEDLNCLEHQIQNIKPTFNEKTARFLKFKIVPSFQPLGPKQSPIFQQMGPKQFLPADGAKIVPSFQKLGPKQSPILQQMGPKQSLASSRWGQNSPQLPADGAKIIPSFQQMGPKLNTKM